MENIAFDLKNWLLKFEFLRGDGLWITQSFLIIFFALLLDFIIKNILRKFKKRLERTKNPWDEAVLESLIKPLSIFIWMWGITIAANIIADSKDISWFDTVIPVIRTTGIILIITWFVLRLIIRFEKNIIRKGRETDPTYDVTTVQAVTKLLRISAIITCALIVLQDMGVSISGVLAFGGIGGIAVGFAAKDLLANFFGGLMLYLDRPFKVGDWIRSPDRDIEGTVEYIGWRLTCIRTFDKRPLYLPNSLFATIAVENPSRMTHRRIYETIGVRYDDSGKLPEILTDVKNMLLRHDEIDSTQTMIVNFNEFSESSLDFFVYTFTKTTNWIKFHEVKQDVLLRIMQIIQQHGAEIAFPTSTVHIDGNLDVPMPTKI